MKLTVIIPVYNEAKTIRQIIDSIESVRIPGIEKQLVVVNDFSTDETLRILKTIQGIKLVSHDKNYGKGRAIRTGIENSEGDVILIQDADLEYNPRDYPRLLGPILDGKTDVVYGSRFFRGFRGDKIFCFGNRLLSGVTNILYNVKLTDMETCYKVFRRRVLEGVTLKSDRFEIEPEITAKILKKGHQITEVPIDYLHRGRAEGKKITPLDGVTSLFTLIKYRILD